MPVMSATMAELEARVAALRWKPNKPITRLCWQP
jgi:hypothetical protein